MRPAARLRDVPPEQYHRRELLTARDSTDPRRAVPDLPPECRSVLDVGAGAGQTLLALNPPAGSTLYAVDIDSSALRLGREWAPHITFVRAAGEGLPFPSERFDFVISRVALPFMHMPSALAEMERVLEPGGRIWMVLHPFAVVRDHWLRSLRSFRWKDLVFRSYVVVNGLWWSATGRQFRFPLRRARCESFQTDEGIRRALTALGFADVQITRTPKFVVTARKPARTP
jgi:ubiquinone/menaquinone biosynthesis C-methylase UbiE